LQDYDEAVSLHPDSMLGLVGRGEVLAALGRGVVRSLLLGAPFGAGHIDLHALYCMPHNQHQSSCSTTIERMPWLNYINTLDTGVQEARMQWEQALQKFTASNDLALLERLLALLEGQPPPSRSPSVHTSNVQPTPQEAQLSSSSAAAKAQACSYCPHPRQSSTGSPRKDVYLSHNS